MKKTLRISLLVLVLLVLIFLGLVIIFIARNTAFLNTNINSQDIELNNTNPFEDSTDYVSLESKTLIVPLELKTGIFEIDKNLLLPNKFKISLWANDLNKPRHIDWTDGNTMIVSNMGAGEVLLIKSTNGVYGDQRIVVDSNLNKPHGIDFYKGNLYLGEENQISVYRDLKEDGTYSSKEVLISNLPVGGHSTRTVKVGPDEKIYVTIGSSCNVCNESDERRASMLIADLDGQNVKVFAEGLRNTVDFVFRQTPNGFKIWGVDNGRDLIGDDIPPEEVNIIEEGSHYGWPYCYGNGINNPEYPERAGYCKTETRTPVYQMQAHSAPLGLTFMIDQNTNKRTKFPLQTFKDDVFVAFHGSWNRTIPTGYKIIRINTSALSNKEVNFITGWLEDDGKPWGRPVDVKFDNNGDMFITDDFSNAIYKVEYVDVE